MLGLWLTAVFAHYIEHLDAQLVDKNSVLLSFSFEDSTYVSPTIHHLIQGRNEIHIRMTQGFWPQSWGLMPGNGTYSGGTGAEVWAWLESNNSSSWNQLTNELSGLFCASLNFLDETNLVRPKNMLSPYNKGDSSSFLYYGSLPREPVCTENLTPFIKLLPCKGSAGFSSLLDGHILFDSLWQSLAVDIISKTDESGTKQLMIQQYIHVVLDLNRLHRLSHSHVPQNLPRELYHCKDDEDYCNSIQDKVN